MDDLTRCLNESGDGEDHDVLGELYSELKKIARSRMRNERRGQTLNSTALVNEAWLRLQKSAPKQWRDRRQFYGAAAEAMRRILVEAARRRLTKKRGQGEGAVPLEEDDLPLTSALPDDRLLEIHEVLDQLEAESEMDARIVKLRFFGGMNTVEIAALLEVSESTVLRHWGVAKVWLYRALSEEDENS